MATLIGNRRTRNIVLQAAFIACIAAVIVTAVSVTRHNMATQGMAMGWDFLHYAAGWRISFTLIPYDVGDTYLRALEVGLLNTLLLGSITIVLAVSLGTAIGTARLADHKLTRSIAAVFVQTVRNLPLILQAFFWYSVLSNLPPARAAIALPGSVYLSGRGIFFPGLNASWVSILSVLVVLVAGITLAVICFRKGNQVLSAFVSLCAVALAAIFLVLGTPSGMPLLNLPVAKGLRFDGGIGIVPEFGAAIIAISLFGAAYIAEIVRAGFLAVPRGLNEAGLALGLNSSQIFWRIRLPLMIRFILPTMTNQVVWLMKATTIGFAIGFNDFFGVISQSINHSGQTVSLVLILILGFWTINMTLAFAMNALNRHLAIPGHKK